MSIILNIYAFRFRDLNFNFWFPNCSQLTPIDLLGWLDLIWRRIQIWESFQNLWNLLVSKFENFPTIPFLLSLWLLTSSLQGIDFSIFWWLFLWFSIWELIGDTLWRLLSVFFDSRWRLISIFIIFESYFWLSLFLSSNILGQAIQLLVELNPFFLPIICYSASQIFGGWKFQGGICTKPYIYWLLTNFF